MAWDYGSYVNEYKGPKGRIREEGKYLGVYPKVDDQRTWLDNHSDVVLYWTSHKQASTVLKKGGKDEYR